MNRRLVFPDWMMSRWWMSRPNMAVVVLASPNTSGLSATRLISWRRHRKDEKDQAEEPWRTIESPKTAWATAMKVIEGEFGRRWRWHDIRAAYITQVAKTAGPMAAQALARHSDFRTTQGYIGLSDQDMRDGADMAALRPSLALLKGGKT